MLDTPRELTFAGKRIYRTPGAHRKNVQGATRHFVLLTPVALQVWLAPEFEPPERDGQRIVHENR